MQSQNSIMITMFLLLVAISIGKGAHAENLKVASNKQVVLANESLKRYFDIKNPNASKIKNMLAYHEFKELEKFLENTYQQYKKDFNYEGFLHKSYKLFSPDHNVSLEDLNLWVSKTGSCMAYAARGYYKVRLGLIARGSKFIRETPRNKLEEMQRLHNEAASDLQIAVEKKTAFMPAYTFLITTAAFSNMPFTARQIADKAIKEDKRTFEVRMSYMYYLQPKWGGTYEEMEEFAKDAIKYVRINPRLWALQGDADAYRAMQYEYEGNYTSAIESYNSALQFGDRVNLLKKRAALYNKIGKREKAVADYKRVLLYIPTDTTALQFTVPDNPEALKFVIMRDGFFVDPNISKLNISSYAVLSVECPVAWVKKRKGYNKALIYNNIRKIEQMVNRLGCRIIERSSLVESLDEHHMTLSDLTDEKAKQIGRYVNADAVIIATIPNMGKHNPLNKYFEEIVIRSVSVKTGKVIWNAKLIGNVDADPDKFEHTLLLDTIESKLYDYLEKMLRMPFARFNS